MKNLKKIFLTVLGAMLLLNCKKFDTMASDTVQSKWLLADNNWYYINEDGSFYTGWLYKDGSWYYLLSDGVMVTGELEVDGITYFFEDSGAMREGWRYLDGYWYFFDGYSQKYKGWLLKENNWYYMNNDGVMLTGWQYINGAEYYLNYNGEMETGWQWINDEWYYFNEDGAMVNGWLYNNGSWYYMNTDGVMQEGWLQLWDRWYYLLEESGTMVVGKYTVDGTDHFFNENGEWVQDMTGMLDMVRAYEGTSYRYGGSTPNGWDCSGFVQWIMRNLFTVSLPRTAAEQSKCGSYVNAYDESAWEPGDLLFYVRNGSVGHVAIYLGDGMLMHALNTKKGTCIENAKRYDYYDKENTLAYVRRVWNSN